MADTFEIEIATPERLVVRQRTDSANIRGADGYFGVLAGHAALLSELGEGYVGIAAGEQSNVFFVTGGYVEVRDNHVRVLADSVTEVRKSEWQSWQVWRPG